MYTVIVADDEKNIIQLIANFINHFSGEFEVVGVTDNGQETIDQVLEYRPDILVTDICMPFKSGLDVVRELHERGVFVKTVIISGYADFAYAKTAISLGVTDYLLKPFTPEELMEVLKKIGEEIGSQRNLQRNINEMIASLEDHSRLERKRFLKKIMEEDAKQLLDLYEDLHEHLYCVSIMHFVNMADEKSGIRFMNMVMPEYFHSEITMELLEFGDRKYVVLFTAGGNNSRWLKREVQAGYESMQKSFEKYYHIGFYCSNSKIYSRPEDLSSAYYEAGSIWVSMKDMDRHIWWYGEGEMRTRGNAGIAGISGETEKQDSDQALWDQEYHLRVKIQEGDAEGTLTAVDQIMACYPVGRESYEMVRVQIWRLIYSISDIMEETDRNCPIWKEELYRRDREYLVYGTLSDMGLFLREYALECASRMKEKTLGQSDLVVRQIKELVNQNIGNEYFNLETAAAKLSFSSNYVRQLFKQKSGTGFSEYVIERRMLLAGELLKTPGIKIQQVAAKTGYSNSAYFASSFKKFFGFTPTEYKNREKEMRGDLE